MIYEIGMRLTHKDLSDIIFTIHSFYSWYDRRCVRISYNSKIIKLNIDQLENFTVIQEIRVGLQFKQSNHSTVYTVKKIDADVVWVSWENKVLPYRMIEVKDFFRLNIWIGI